MRQFPSSLVALCLLLLNYCASTINAYSVTGKRVLVTGSSGGIGRGIAIKLAEEGAEVFVHYNQREEGARETRRLIEDRGGICAGISQCDFSHPAHIHALFQQINGVWRDGMDILINNAGVISKLACEDDDDYVSQWRDTMNINLNAPRLLSQLALKGMKRRGGGVIINVSSIHGERSNEYMSAYAVSKAGLDALTRCMAIEFAEHKVRVNAIAPGVVKVERTEQHFRDPANVTPWTERLLINEIGSVQHVADATLPLIANDWITGTIWTVDGGMSARSNMPLRSRPEDYTPAKLPDSSDPNTGAPAPYSGERLGQKPMPGQVGPSFPQQGYNAGRLADQPMPGQPGFGETQRGNPARQEEGTPNYVQQQPGNSPTGQRPTGGRNPNSDPRERGYVPEGGAPPPQRPGQPGGRPGERPGPNYGRPEERPGDRDPRGRVRPGFGPGNMQDFGPPQEGQGRNMNMPGEGFGGTGGMPGQGYIPRAGQEKPGGPPGSRPDNYGRRGGNPPPRDDSDYRPLDDPNDEPPRGGPPRGGRGGSYNNPREPRTHL